MAKKKKIILATPDQKYLHSMKIVTSNQCLSCKKQCKKGIAYLGKMSKPGAIGRGVPCILTKGKAFK